MMIFPPLHSVYTPVCLPSPTDTFYGDTAVVSGWGRVTKLGCVLPGICDHLPTPPPDNTDSSPDVLMVGAFIYLSSTMRASNIYRSCLEPSWGRTTATLSWTTCQ